MSQLTCGLAAETKIETPEGGLTARGVAGKNVSVFTREPEGRVRFRRILNARCVAENQPVLRVTLESGVSFRVAPDQVFYKKGMTETRADKLQSGDELLPAFCYLEGYEYVDDRNAATTVSNAAIRVTKVEPAGNSDLYAFGVNRTGNFFLSAGVLCKAETV
jgi:hypothetical protein